MKKNLLIFFVFIIFLSTLKVYSNNEENNKEEKKIQGVSVIDDISKKIEVTCPKKNDAYVIIGFGQSNSANSSGHRFENNKTSILNFFNGKCYLANDPMLGATGNHGSVWIPLAKHLDIKNKSIVFATFGVGGTHVKSWLDKYHLLPFYKKNIKDLKTHYPNPDAAVWIQGERDATTPSELFKKQLKEWINIIQQDLPSTIIYITGTSYCKGVSNSKILEIQKNIAENLTNGVYVGSTDNLNQTKYRYDDCHFSEQGTEELAKLIASRWLK